MLATFNDYLRSFLTCDAQILYKTNTVDCSVFLIQKFYQKPLFYRLNLLDIYKINFLHIVKFMYCYHHNLLPSSFHNLFITSCHIHSYNTRNANAYRLHTCRTNIKRFTILFQGPKKWNSLLDKIKNSETLNCFRNGMLKYLIQP